MSLADSREADKLIGTVFADRYLVQSRLGKGGMAVVYKCLDKNLQRDVALKVLRTDVAPDPVAAKRLIREARAAAALHHPNIITIHDVGERDGTVFLVMEVLVGKPMADLMESQGAVSVERAIHMAEQVASALVVAHQNGIVHRDIKPENLFLIDSAGGGDFIKMLDFSIAKLPTQMVTAALTRAGSVFGTPHYMAPEQVEGKPAGPQTDLYALGAVLHELIMGEPPFDGPSVIDILLKHVKQPPPRMERPGLRLPAGLADLTQQMLAKKVQDRPASAALVRDRLGAMLAEVRHASSDADEVVAAPVAAVTESAPPAPQAPPPLPAHAPARQSGVAARPPPHAKRPGLETLPHDAPELDDLPSAPPVAAADELHLPDVAPPRKFSGFGGDDDDGEGRTMVGVGLASAINEVAQRAKSGAVAPKRPSVAHPPAPTHAPATVPPPPVRRAPQSGGLAAGGVDAPSAVQRPSLAGRTAARPPTHARPTPVAPPPAGPPPPPPAAAPPPPPSFAENTAGRRANPQLHRQPTRAPSNKFPAVDVDDRATTSPQIDADPATLQRSAADHETISPPPAAPARSNALLYVAIAVAAIGVVGIGVTIWLFTRGG